MLAEMRRINAFLATHPLTRRRRLSATARVLRWQIASRIHDEVIVDWIGGTRFAARRGMTGVTGNIYAGLHEFADMAFVLHFLRAGARCPDPNSGPSPLYQGLCSHAEDLVSRV